MKSISSMQVSSLCEPTNLGIIFSLPHTSWYSLLENLTWALNPQLGVCSLTVWYEVIYQIICVTGMASTEWPLFFLPNRVKKSKWYLIHKVLNTMQDTEYTLRLSLIFFQICLEHNLLFIFFYLLLSVLTPNLHLIITITVNASSSFAKKL